MKIIQSRLEGVPGNIVDSDAVQFASRKVAAVSGDARRVLDICRRAVEIAEAEVSMQEPAINSSSRRGKGKEAPEQESDTILGRVTISTIKQAINEATSTPVQQCLKSLPVSSKLLLAAFLARIRRNGITEGITSEIIEEAKRLGQMVDIPTIDDFLLREKMKVHDGVTLSKLHNSQVAPRIVAMGVAAVQLTEAGIISLERRKGERPSKMRLNIGEDEIKLALKGDNEIRGLGLS